MEALRRVGGREVKVWQRAEIARLQQMYNEGKSDEEIGNALGRTAAAIGRHRSKVGIVRVHRYSKERVKRQRRTRPNGAGGEVEVKIRPEGNPNPTTFHVDRATAQAILALLVGV